MKKTVSEVQITPVKAKDGLIAFCSFVLYESLYCSSVAVYTRPDGGIRLAYPTKKLATKDIDLFHPITRELGSKIEKAVNRKLRLSSFTDEIKWNLDTEYKRMLSESIKRGKLKTNQNIQSNND